MAITRWIPLALFVAFFGIVRWRIAYQRRRFGGVAVHFDKAGDRRQRNRDRAGALAFLGLTVQTILVGFGRVALVSNPLALWAGTFLGIVGISAMLHAQLQMGASWRIGIDPSARTPLVRHGWYRVSRNPIYVFVFTFLASEAVLVPNVFTWIVCAGIVMGVNVQVRKEERWLEATYGDEWRDYARRVGRFVPGIGCLRGRDPRGEVRA